MKISIKVMLVGILAVPALALASLAVSPIVSPVGAACVDGKTMEDGLKCTETDTPLCLFGGPDCAFTIVTNAALYIIGAVSVLMLIYGGVKYTISGGDEKAVTSAKNTILYSVVGVIVAIMAYAIVNFVITQFK